MSQSDNDKRKEIAKAKFITNTSIQDIADELKVSRRTIERWANNGGWRETRRTEDSARQISREIRPESKTNLVTFEKPVARTGEFRDLLRPQEIDDIEIIIAAIAELHASLPSCEDKSKGGIAGALARLIDLKRKIKPDTVADLVERAIELGIGPDELLRELRESWARRA